MRKGYELPQNRGKAASIKQELPLLKARAKTLSIRLDRLNRHIRRVEQPKRIPFHVAVVDTQKCLGCGVCESACPVGAIALGKVARVNPARCIGCGICARQCPEGAIHLRSKPIVDSLVHG
jgi:ferredoxin